MKKTKYSPISDNLLNLETEMSNKRVSYDPNTLPVPDDIENLHNDVQNDNHGRDNHLKRQSSIQHNELLAQLPSKQIDLDDPHSKTFSLERDRRRSTLRRRRSTRVQNGADEVDLTIEPNLTTEHENWERQQTLRNVTASLDKKRVLRRQLMSTPTQSLTGVQKWKHDQSVRWAKFKTRASDLFSQVEVWKGSLKTIEGYYGTGVLSYFRFVKTLMFLNFLIAIIMIGVILVPQKVLKPETFEIQTCTNDTMVLQPVVAAAQSVTNVTSSSNVTLSPNVTSSPIVTPSGQSRSSNASYGCQSLTCSIRYKEYVENFTATQNAAQVVPAIQQVLDFLQGTGWMERTEMFIGYYFNKTYTSVLSEMEEKYNMPLAYLCSVGAYFTISLLLMVQSTASGIKASLVNREERFYQYCNKIFCGWEYGITREKPAALKMKNISFDLEQDLIEQRRQVKQKNLNRGQKCRLYFIRIIVNIGVLAILGGAFFCIFKVQEETYKLASTVTNAFLVLLIQYLPALTITLLNVIIPIVFLKVVTWEEYAPAVELNITLIRTVFLRLSSLAVLIVVIANQILCNSTAEDNAPCTYCDRKTQCWETYVGQQLYKLALLDFLVNFASTFLYELPRKLLVKYFVNVKLVQWVGPPEFQISKCVLDVVYSQVLCWLGAFFSPFIPAMTFVKFFLLFYMKKFTLLKSCVPSQRPYRASKANFFFMVILLVSFALCCVPIGYVIAIIKPSKGCSPFRIHSSESYTMWSTIGDLVNSWPGLPQQIFTFLGSPGFYIPFVIVLGLLLYYYYAVSVGHKHYVQLLSEQLALEGRDKQFLLSRVQEALLRGEITSNSMVRS
ncbi:unnamed protein product [Owenia fusiformis]|uniref:Uncharacterized protein n=1 Tax=Owenia fusiformis TaxID=6347 RepID=A0A8J1XXK2_OWEFU|nr:unnamed protein product [Owenia fusiformis]